MKTHLKIGRVNAPLHRLDGSIATKYLNNFENI